MCKKIILENYAVLTPLGNLEETVKDLLIGESAVSKKTLFDLDIPFAQFKVSKYRLLKECVKNLKNNIKYNITFQNNEKIAFIYAAAKGDLSGLEAAYLNGDNKSDISPLLDLQAEFICSELGVKPDYITVISNACASGQIALERAMEFLTTNQFDRAIVFGFDAIYKFTASGFFSLSALSPVGAKPFDKDRDGLTMGEGAAISVLSFKEPHQYDIIISGAGSSNDANHRTGPSRTGEGLATAISEAIKDSGINFDNIGAIKCHGTSTNYNDAMEAKALFTIFGNNCPPAVSLKGALGHMSGAGSLVETILAAELLKENTIPKTTNFKNIGTEEPISISSQNQNINKPVILCLAAGFGGINSAVIVEQQI